MAQVGWIVNQRRCIGCRTCLVACKSENNTPLRTDWRYVVEKESGTYPSPKRAFISMACNHCEEPACLKACPTDAISKDESDGAVLIDVDRCTGCRSCYFICPYGAPRIDTDTGKVTKCTMCAHRREAGLPPACSSTCLTGALQFVEDFVGPTQTPPEGFNTPFLTRPSVHFILAE